MSERGNTAFWFARWLPKVLRRSAYPLEGRNIWLFKVFDDFNREALGIEVGFSLLAERVIRYLMQIISWRSRPWCCSSQDVIALHKHCQVVRALVIGVAAVKLGVVGDACSAGGAPGVGEGIDGTNSGEVG